MVCKEYVADSERRNQDASLLPQQIVGKNENDRIWVRNCKIFKDRERWK